VKKIAPLIFGFAILFIISTILIVGLLFRNTVSFRDEFKDNAQLNGDDLFRNVVTISSKKN